MKFDESSPIWLQLVAEFTRQIASGKWPTGSRIQGVRELAVDLGVNPNTVQRALAELERSGLAYSERTSGRFVTGDATAVETLRSDLVVAAVDDYITQTSGLGLSAQQATTVILERWPANDDPNPGTEA